MPDPKQTLQKAVDAQRKVREAAAEAARKLEEERTRQEQQPRP